MEEMKRKKEVEIHVYSHVGSFFWEPWVSHFSIFKVGF